MFKTKSRNRLGDYFCVIEYDKGLVISTYKECHCQYETDNQPIKTIGQTFEYLIPRGRNPKGPET